METNIYKIWSADNSKPVYFVGDQLEEYAERYEFDAKELIATGGVEFVCDFSGELLGGVVFVNWVRYYADSLEHSLDVSIPANSDLDGFIPVAWCHNENELIHINANAFDWEAAQ